MEITGLTEKEFKAYSVEIYKRLLDSEKDSEADKFAEYCGFTKEQIQAYKSSETPHSPSKPLDAFTDFNKYTALGKLREELYHYGRTIVISTNTVGDLEQEISLEYKLGNIYKNINEIDYSKDKSSNNTALIASLGLVIKNAYTENGVVYLIYRMPFDKEDQIVEFDIAVEKISAIARLSTSQTHFLWRLLVGIVKEFIEIGDRNLSENGIYVIEGKVRVISEKFDTKKVLEDLKALYEVTDEGMKPIFSNTLLYSAIIPLNESFRQKEYLFPALLIYGKAGDGKSAIAKLCIVKGYGNRFLDKTEQDVATLASMRENFSRTNLPLLIEEISEKAMEKHVGYLKSALTGTGSASRGRKSGGNMTWHTRTIPVYTSNEGISIDSGMNRRLFKMHSFSSVNKNVSIWKNIYNSIPDGFMYTIAAAYDGRKIDEIIKECVSAVSSDSEIIYSYLTYMEKLVSDLYKSYGLESPFKSFKIREQDEQDLYNAFIDYFTLAENDYDNRSRVKPNVDFVTVVNGETTEFYITAKGYGIFKKDYPKAPDYLTTFIDNAPQTEEVTFKYVVKRVLGHSQRVALMTIKNMEKRIYVENKKLLDEYPVKN